MRYPFLFFLFLFSVSLYGQDRKFAVFQNLDTTYASLSTNWNYKKGDNPKWKEFDFDDKDWKTISRSNIAVLDSIEKIEQDDIYWFRKYMRSEVENDSLLLLLAQRGASEVYLNGKQILKVGEIGRDGTQSEAKGWDSHFGAFGLEEGKEYVLAIRYQYLKSNLILPEKTNPGLEVRLASISKALDLGVGFEWVRKDVNDGKFMIFFSLGITSFLVILFIGLWIYTKEKASLYLTFLSISLTLLSLQALDRYNFGFRDDYYPVQIFLQTLLIITVHLAAYEIMERRTDIWKKIILPLCLAPIIASFFFQDQYVYAFYVIITIISILRLTYLQWNLQKAASRTFLILTLIICLQPIVGLLESFTGQSFGLSQILPFTSFALPVGFALYVVGTLGVRTDRLKRNLLKVERLSHEREDILESQNEKLEKEVAQRTKDLQDSLENLKSTQTKLIQSEKMASLGELTAGIAHEIQNPLNFVNNFSEVSGELVDELNEELEKGDLEEVKFIASDLKSNLGKIKHHGGRAGDIVRNMLDHSRKSDGQREETDLNALADEYLRLSYHGMRAKDKSFKADFETDLDSRIPNIIVNASEMSRVFLNLINNAFYEVNKKAQVNPNSSYKPKVVVKSSLIEFDGQPTGAEFIVSDNANGIPDDIKSKIFQPFFTTKPTGSGTGLGLSLTYDIINAHMGDLEVQSEKGVGTQMMIYLPIQM